MDRELIGASNGARAHEGRDAQGLRTRLSTTDLVNLIALMRDHSELHEITIEHEATGFKLTLRKPAPVMLSVAASPYLTGDTGPSDDAEERADARDVDEPTPQRTVNVCAPLVGIFRASIKPDGEPLFGPGDTVRQGQIVAAIEALNVPNDVEAVTSGRVREVRAEDGQRVEYGQVLFVIEPAS